MSSIVTEGEWSFVFIAGAFSHALLKKPASGDYRVHGMYGGSIARADPDEGDLARALDIHSRLPFDLLYSRLDLVRTADGLAVMEVELIEPFLYFEIAPEAVGRLIEAVIRKLQESPRRTQ